MTTSRKATKLKNILLSLSPHLNTILASIAEEDGTAKNVAIERLLWANPEVEEHRKRLRIERPLRRRRGRQPKESV